MLGSVAEASRLVAPRNIRIVHAISGNEAAIPAAGGAVVTEGFDNSVGGTGGGGGSGIRASAGGVAAAGVGAGAADAVLCRDQVPLFR